MNLDIHALLPQRKDWRIGVLGSGFIVNECHLVAYRKAGFNPVAIASRTRAHAEQTAQRHGIAKVYDTYENLLDDPSIEVLDIAVPPNAQLTLIKAACARKTVKGILAQKPLGMNYAEALEAVIACENAGIELAVNQNMRYDQSVRAAKTLLNNGTLGGPVFATMDMRATPHWVPWSKESGWVTLRMMSINHLDCFRYWFGDPESVYCSVRTDPRTKFPHQDGIATYILEYRNGLRCVGIDDTWTGPAKEGCPADTRIHWRIEGTNGLAIGDLGWCKDPYTTPSTIRYAAKGDNGFHQPTWSESWFPDAFIGTMAQLLVALETGDEPVLSGRDNLQTMALVDAAYQSASQNYAVTLHEITGFGAVQAKAEKAKQNSPGLFGKLISKFAQKFESKIASSGSEPIKNFTPRAQQVLALARMEADRFNHNFVGTEHLLLGLLRLGQGVAVNVLQKLGLDLEAVRLEVEKQVGTGPDQRVLGNIPYTPRVKKVLALAQKEAKALTHTYVGTEHILLGLLREGDGVAARVLKNLDVDIEQTRLEILKELDPNFTPEIAAPLSKRLTAEADDIVPLSLPTTPAFTGATNNLTPRAQSLLSLARNEAERLNHQCVDTEHLLFGLIRLNQGTAVNALRNLGLDLEQVRLELEKQIDPGPGQKVTGTIPYTQRVKKVLSLAAKEAQSMTHTYVGTEHILLGLLREGDSLAAQILKNLDVDIEQTRQEILKELDPNFGITEEEIVTRQSAENTAAEPEEKKLYVPTVLPPFTPAGWSVEFPDNFTPRAHKLLVLARVEADRFNHDFIDTGHLLLGLRIAPKDLLPGRGRNQRLKNTLRQKSGYRGWNG